MTATSTRSLLAVLAVVISANLASASTNGSGHARNKDALLWAQKISLAGQPRVTLYADIGITRPFMSGDRFGVIYSAGLEIIRPPFAVDFLGLGVGDGSIGYGEPGTSVSGPNIVLKIVPVDNPYLTVSGGVGLGIVKLEQIDQTTEYEAYGSPALGVLELTLFPGLHRLKLRAIRTQVRFPADLAAPILEQRPDVGNGWLFTSGLTIQFSW